MTPASWICLIVGVLVGACCGLAGSAVVWAGREERQEARRFWSELERRGMGSRPAARRMR